jgi:hypothetical protein
VASNVVATVSIATYFTLKFTIRPQNTPGLGTLYNIVSLRSAANGNPLLAVFLDADGYITIKYNGSPVISEAILLSNFFAISWTTISISLAEVDGLSKVLAYSSYDASSAISGGISVLSTVGQQYLLSASSNVHTSTGGFIRDLVLTSKFRLIFLLAFSPLLKSDVVHCYLSQRNRWSWTALWSAPT